ncbi:MAG: glycosyltransferase family 2 protein [Terrimicrobiaceae bacterium]|nr:glycosyltransferase family 2 protein [Terrimicrobiaceae bacterium]
MKVIIQIPCYNEEATLALALKELPRELPGVDTVEWLVVDDGSTDRTAEVARACGVDHVICRPHEGLARTFMAGMEACLARGADVIVNTDADNQYQAADIPKILAPVLAGEADMVVGGRPIGETEHFSPLKKLLQRVGSAVVRMASSTRIADAPSGFRAISREAALRLNVFNDYTYTLETIIQCGQRNMRVVSVPVRTNPDLRPSRLLHGLFSYVQRSMLTILRIFLVYKPLRFFVLAGAVPFGAGLGLMLRWLWLFLFVTGTTRSHVPSLVLAAVLVISGLQLWAIGLLADIIAVNRRLLEDIQLRLRRRDYGG